MPKLFISYRRDDSADAAGRLHDRLESHFGKESLFFDVDSIPPGQGFCKRIGDEVGKCDALLAVIGDNWLNARGKDGNRRLDNPEDFVRIEIASALARGIPVVPVLIGDASMPNETDLPNDLKELTRRNAVIVRSGSDFRDQATRLIEGLKRLLPEKKVSRSRIIQRQMLIPLMIVLLLLSGLAYWFWPKPKNEAPVTEQREELRVKSFAIDHFEWIKAQKARPKGVLGEKSFGAYLADQVTLDVEFNRPAYAYLVAFRPDGVMELINPNWEDEVRKAFSPIIVIRSSSDKDKIRNRSMS